MNRREYLSLLSIPVSSSIAGCSVPHADLGRDSSPASNSLEPPAWPMFRRDYTNKGCNQRSLGPRTSPSIKWKYKTQDAIWGSPVVSENTIYFGSYDGHLYALSESNGDLKWKFKTNNRIDGSPGISGNVVVIGSFDKNIYGIDARSGDLIWKFDTGGIIRSSPTIYDDVVYIGSHCRYTECARFYEDTFPREGFVFAIDLFTGEEIWKFKADDEVLSTPAVYQEKVYVGSSDMTIYALDSNSGDVIWDYQTDGMVFSSPAIGQEKVFVGSTDGKVYSLHTDTGDISWIYDTGGDLITSSPASCADSVFIGASETAEQGGVMEAKFYALSQSSGDMIWSRSIPGQIVGSSPGVDNNQIYFGSHNISEGVDETPGIFAFSESGELNWKLSVKELAFLQGSDGFGSSPAVTPDSLYIGCADGYMLAVS